MSVKREDLFFRLMALMLGYSKVATCDDRITDVFLRLFILMCKDKDVEEFLSLERKLIGEVALMLKEEARKVEEREKNERNTIL